MNKENTSYEMHLQEAFARANQKADQFGAYVTVGAFLFGIAIAPIYSTWFFALGIGIPNMLLFYIAAQWIKSRFISCQLISLVFAIFMFQFISQMHGMAEMHFFCFIFALILVIYQDWRMMIPYTIATVFHHGLFFALQLSGFEGMGPFFISYAHVDYMILGFHLGLAATMTFFAGIWAYFSKRQGKQMAKNNFKQLESLKILDQGVRFAEEISNGNMESPYELKNEEDKLGKALLDMRQYLLAAHQKEKEDRFIHEGIERINKVQQQNLDNVRSLCDAVLRDLANYMQISQAGIFLPQVDSTQEGTVLELVASYAYHRKKFLKKEIFVGKYAEGIVGQVFLEKQAIYLEEIPQGYNSIITGLGEVEPKSLLIIPLLLHQEVIGIMELSAIRSLSPYEMEFLNRVTEGLAATLKFSQISHQTRFLLEESQHQAEQLRAQEEEMRQNMEELQATQEAMSKRQMELEESNKLLQEKEAQLQVAQEKLEALSQDKSLST